MVHQAHALCAWRPDHRLPCHCCTQRTPGSRSTQQQQKKATLFDERVLLLEDCRHAVERRKRGAWKIDDIRGTDEGKEWSIRKMLHQG